VIGYTFGIPDSLMHVTFIAAGTSIPDAYSSVIVVKQGMVDMGVSNIIGSNAFDLLIGLAFPWFMKSIFSGGYVIYLMFFFYFVSTSVTCYHNNKNDNCFNYSILS
jgi:Ca2+/Na+ antiporter